MSITASAVVAFGLLAGSAYGQSTTHRGNYLNLSVSGDGETPTALELFSRGQVQAQSQQAAVTGGERGDASYAIPISLPPARVQPDLSLVYSSGRGVGWVGRGWSISAGVEITRPWGSAARAYADEEDVRLVQGGGLDGLLVLESGSWRWVSSTPSALVASYDDSTKVWTLKSGTSIWTLAPATSTATSPNRWVTTSITDRVGNRADLSWSDGRLDSIAYGSTNSATHFLEVSLLYAMDPSIPVLRRAAGGPIEVMDGRLEAIEIASKHGHTSFEPRARYDLYYDLTWEHLQEVVHVGIDASVETERVLAVLEYSELVDDAALDEDDAPPHIGYSMSGARGDGTSRSDTRSALADVNLDGLPDAVSWPWHAGWMRLDRDPVDPELVTRWWEPFDERPLTGADPGEYLDETVTVRTSLIDPLYDQYGRGTYTTRRWIDVDGDGYQDLVESPNEPLSWDGSLGHDSWPLNLQPTGLAWRVWYGTRDGFVDAPNPNPEIEYFTNASPLPYPAVSRRPDLAESSTCPQTQDWQDFHGNVVDMMDVDGDGWQDLVEIDGTAFTWYREQPQRNLGWEATPRTALSGVAMQSTQASLGAPRMCLDEPIIQVDGGLHQETPTMAEMYAVTGFLDLNGDGQSDYVDTSPHQSTGNWSVRLGRGNATFASPIDWPAPVGWLSYTDEGKPAVASCHVDVNAGPGPLPVTFETEPFEIDGGTSYVFNYPVINCYEFAAQYQVQTGGLAGHRRRRPPGPVGLLLGLVPQPGGRVRGGGQALPQLVPRRVRASRGGVRQLPGAVRQREHADGGDHRADPGPERPVRGGPLVQ